MLDFNAPTTPTVRVAGQDDRAFRDFVWEKAAKVDRVALHFVDPDLDRRFYEQSQISSEVAQSNSTLKITEHGEALLRGCAACNQAIRAAHLTIRGSGKHPGPAPRRMGSGAIARSRRDYAQVVASREFKVWYRLYLLTAEWEHRRQAVFERCAGRCEGCRAADASQVHHLTYEPVGRELFFDLVGICDQCHAVAHAA